MNRRRLPPLSRSVCVSGSHSVFCCCSSSWTPQGVYLESNRDECTVSLVYAVHLEKQGSVSFTYQYPDNNIFFEFYVRNIWSRTTCTWADANANANSCGRVYNFRFFLTKNTEQIKFYLADHMTSIIKNTLFTFKCLYCQSD